MELKELKVSELALMLENGKKMWSPEFKPYSYCIYDPEHYIEHPYRRIAPGYNFVMRDEWALNMWTEYREPIEDKYLCEFWDEHTHSRSVGFFDAKAPYDVFRAFTTRGKRNGTQWKNVRRIPLPDWPLWALEAHKTLED